MMMRIRIGRAPARRPSRLSRGRGPLLLALAVVLGLPLTWGVSNSAFTASTGNSGSSIASATDFYSGTLDTWGGGHELLPVVFDSGTTWTVVSGSGDHACGLKSAGTLWCWGTGSSLGNGSAATVTAPTQVTSPASTGWSKVSAGRLHTCAIRTDGKLYCWGTGTDYQTGLGSTAVSSTPQQVGSATNWTAISAGANHSCGLRGTNAMYCWGGNTYGQVGNNASGADVTTPAAVALPGGSTSWTSIQLGNNFSCGLTNTTALYCWGWGNVGRLGTGSTTDQDVPTAVVSPSTTGWSGLSTGSDFGCALRSGSIYCWGYNLYGQFGSGTNTNNSTPQLNTGGSSWSLVSTGYHHACGKKSGGTLWCWGDNGEGAMGTGDQADSNTPVQITASGLTVSTLFDGSDSRISWTVTSTGTLWGWGRYFDKQPDIVAVDATTTWKAPTAGLRHFCGLQGTGTLWCWGQNTDGRVGDGTTTRRAAPVQVGSWTNWTAVSAGVSHTCGIRALAMYCWGSNATGKVGANTGTASYSSPTAVNGTNTNWSSVSVGSEHACGIRTTGYLSCWGLNSSGQLGIASTTNALAPTQVGSATDWVAVSAGGSHTCGIRTVSLYCWGNGADGRPGQNNTTQQTSPIKVGTASWTAVAATETATCGIQSAGSLWCWGMNDEGQLGIGTTGSSVLVPTQAGTDTGWRTIAGGYTSFCGTQTGRAVYCWGQFRTGSGFGDVTQHTSPTLNSAIRARPVSSGAASRTWFAID
jgi:alpha-tubulin suppressor-like RCC1 family protein